jgi:hypothetical protein
MAYSPVSYNLGSRIDVIARTTECYSVTDLQLFYINYAGINSNECHVFFITNCEDFLLTFPRLPLYYRGTHPPYIERLTMNKQKLEEMATSAFENLTKARDTLFATAETTIEAKQKLETAKYQAQIGGVFDGKNAEIREAQARDHLQANYAELEQAEKNERRARYEFDRAQIDVDTVKTLLRIAELAE